LARYQYRLRRWNDYSSYGARHREVYRGHGGVDGCVKAPRAEASEFRRQLDGEPVADGALSDLGKDSRLRSQQSFGNDGVRQHDRHRNEYLHIVVALAGHEIEEIEEIYFNDDLVPLDPIYTNEPTGFYAGVARVNKHLGEPTQLADSDLVSDTASLVDGQWTSTTSCRGSPTFTFA
jgi:hypothetical protein